MSPRKVNVRNQIPSFLITCEGKKTEPLYFRSFHVGRVLDVRVEGFGVSSTRLVRETIHLKNMGDYDQVWTVFDIDDATHAQIQEAIRLADDNGIQVAYSNQAFELWYLLHFHYHHTSMDRRQYIRRLSEDLGTEYQKNAADIYIRLLNDQPTAIQNAKRLLMEYDPHDPYRDDPCTTVFRLVEELNRYSRDHRR